MNNYDVLVRLQSLEKSQAMLIDKISKVLNYVTPDKQLLDNADMMRLFNMSARTLAYMRSRHEIEFIKVKGKIYYEKEAVKRLIESKHVPNTSIEAGTVIMLNVILK